MRKMPVRTLLCCIIVASLICGCASLPLPGASSSTETLLYEEAVQRGLGSLAITIPAHGWALARVQPASGAGSFNLALPAGRVLRSSQNPELAYLTLAGAAIPSRSPDGGVLIPVAAYYGLVEASGPSSQPAGSASEARGASFRVDETLVRAELVELAGVLSAPNRTWRPSRNPGLIVPQDARHLKRSVFAADAEEWSRARDYFSERTPVQVAVWMLLFNIDRAGLERELIAYGPGMEPLGGQERSAAIRHVVADAFNLWVVLGYDPTTARLASDYPDLAEAAKGARRAASWGEEFPGSSTPLQPLAAVSARDTRLLKSEGLVIEDDYEW